MAELVANFTLNNESLGADFDLSENHFDAVFEINANDAQWGSITGTLSDQTDLSNALHLINDRLNGVDEDIAIIGNDISNLQTSKQNKLTAGENITITEAVELPEGYTLLDSVIADGNQYIDTGIIPDSDTLMNLKFKLLQTVGIAIAGSRDDANRNNFSCFTGSTGYFFEYFNNSNYTNYRLQVANFSANVIYSASISKYSRILYNNIGNVVDANTRINNDNFNATRSIYLGAVNNVDIDGFDGAFYNFQLEKNNILVANYIPCLNPQNIAGFYDTVSETFKRSSTGTDFIAGNIIPASNIISATVPTKVSQLENDKEYLTSGDVSTVALTGDIEDIVGIDIQNPEDGQILVYSEVDAAWQNSSVLDTKQNATSLLVPDTTGMTPIATYEYNISTAAYKVFCTVKNNFTSLSQIEGNAIFKMTITGTNINSVVEGIISMRQTVAAAPYIFLRNFAGTETAALSGIRYIRPTYPKALNNGYDWIFELYPSSSTARHIKLEVFQSSNIFKWNSTLETATINTTYQTTATNITLYNVDGVTGLPSLNISVSSSTSASYISAYLNKFLGGTNPVAGEAISAYNITYLSTDNKMHPQTNTTAIINPDFGLQVARSAVSANATIGGTVLTQKTAMDLTSTPHDSYVQGDMIYLRCTMDSSGNIHSDNYLATSMTTGYTWYTIGTAASATVVNVDTINSMFMTLDSSGNLTHINGKPLGIATNQITIGNTTINESQLQALLNLI